MANIYYRIPGVAVFTNDEPANPPLLAPWVVTTATGYLQELVVVGQASPEIAATLGLQLLVSRASTRVNAVPLDGEVLDAGKLYAIFIPDVPELSYTSVEFFLNAVSVQVEASDPWDYDGTAFGGTANRVSFVAGTYTVEAVVTYPGGTFTITAEMWVE